MAFEDKDKEEKFENTGIKHRDESSEDFWPLAYLKRWMTRDRVVEALRAVEDPAKISDTDVQAYAKIIVPTPPTTETYIRVFAVLTLQEREGYISGFIKHGICDDKLPLKGSDKLKVFSCCDGGEIDQDCFKGWTRSDKRDFEQEQYRVCTPYFSCGERGELKHYDLLPKTILPWVPIENSKKEEKKAGGFGVVERVQMHEDSHGFHDRLKSVSVHFTTTVKFWASRSGTLTLSAKSTDVSSRRLLCPQRVSEGGRLQQRM